MTTKYVSVTQTINLLYIVGLLLAASCACIHFSSAVSSIFFGLAVALGLWCYFKNPERKPAFNLGFLLLFILLPIQIVLELFRTENFYEAWSKILLKAPLLFIPLLYWAGKKTAFKPIGLVFLALPLAWINLASIFNYFKHYAFYNQMVLESKPIPVYSQVYHIEFSLITSLICLLSFIYWYQHKSKLSVTWISGIIIGATLVNLVGLHLLAARTGLLAFYIGLFAFIVANKQWLKHKARIAVFFTLITVVTMLVPSIRNRAVNTFQDISAVVQQKDLNSMSFGQRWVAWQTAFSASKIKPFTGFGLNGVDAAMKTEYLKSNGNLEVKNQITPHNQYLETTLQSGWIVSLVFLGSLILLLIFVWKSANYCGVALLCALIVSMFFESVLERQAGILCFAIVLPFSMGWWESQKD